MQNKQLPDAKLFSVIYRAKDFLNPQYFDCICIGPSVAIFSESSLMSIDYDDRLNERGIKLPDPFKWRLSLYSKEVLNVGIWPKTMLRLVSSDHREQKVKQIAWSDPLFEKNKSASILFVLDTNFQLSLYDHHLAFIQDLHTTPNTTNAQNTKEFIEGVKKVSNLCFALTKPFGSNDQKRSIILAMGGRSSSLQILQMTFSYPSTNPKVTILPTIDLCESGLKEREGKCREVVSMCWKLIKIVQNQDNLLNYQLLVIGLSDGSVRYLLVKIVEKSDNFKLICKCSSLEKILKADFAQIEKISFSKIFVQNPEGLYLFALVVKQFAFCVIRFAIQFKPSEGTLAHPLKKVTTITRIIRPFESRITVARWLNHSLGIITASHTYQVRYWQAGADLSIDLEAEVALPNTGQYDIQKAAIFGLEVSPNDALLIIYAQNALAIETIELSTSPIDSFHPIDRLLRSQIDPSQRIPFNCWDLAIKFATKSYQEIFGIIYHIKSTFLECYEDKPLTPNIIYFLWRVYQVIILLCQASRDQPTQQLNIYISHHVHIAYLLSICRNLEELENMCANGYQVNEEEKLSLWKMKNQINERLNNIKISSSQERISNKIEVDQELNDDDLFISNEGKSFDEDEVEGMEFNEISDIIGEDNEINDTIDDEDASEIHLFPLPPFQLNIESLLGEMMIQKCSFIEPLVRNYQPPVLNCPFCHQLVDQKTMKCSKNHLVELCMKTFQPLIDPSKQMKCHSCHVSALDLSENEAFKWIFDDRKCVLSGHKIEKMKFS